MKKRDFKFEEKQTTKRTPHSYMNDLGPVKATVALNGSMNYHVPTHSRGHKPIYIK